MEKILVTQIVLFIFSIRSIFKKRNIWYLVHIHYSLQLCSKPRGQSFVQAGQPILFNYIHIISRFRTPNSQLSRRFLGSDPLSTLLLFLRSEGFRSTEYKVLLSAVFHQNLSAVVILSRIY